MNYRTLSKIIIIILLISLILLIFLKLRKSIGVLSYYNMDYNTNKISLQDYYTFGQWKTTTLPVAQCCHNIDFKAAGDDCHHQLMYNGLYAKTFKIDFSVSSSGDEVDHITDWAVFKNCEICPLNGIHISSNSITVIDRCDIGSSCISKVVKLYPKDFLTVKFRVLETYDVKPSILNLQNLSLIVCEI